MRISDNTVMLEIARENSILFPVLAWDENEVVLFDTGLPGQLPLFRTAMESVGIAPERITKVILTHQDMDHMGCAKQLAEMGAAILAHEKEAPYIQGERISVKVEAMEKRLSELTEAERARYDRVKANGALYATPVTQRLQDGEILPYCGGIKVIHTPGHTPGHIALWLQRDNLLIAGDAANLTGGVLSGPNPQHTVDMETALVSYANLKQRKPARIVCYHGGLLENPVD